jgi:hypothetical protein
MDFFFVLQWSLADFCLFFILFYFYLKDSDRAGLGEWSELGLKSRVRYS